MEVVVGFSITQVSILLNLCLAILYLVTYSYSLLTDLLFSWFMWITGVSMALRFVSILKNQPRPAPVARAAAAAQSTNFGRNGSTISRFSSILAILWDNSNRSL